MTPTPATHLYVGMWRPPFVELWERGGKTGRNAFEATNCLCGKYLRNPFLEKSKDVASLLHLNAWNCYVAGHFDEPQYEAKP